MKKYLFQISAIAISIFYNINIAFPQTVGFLEFSQDARTLSLGGINLILSPDAYSIFNNTATSAFSEDHMAVSAIYSSWLPKTSDNTILGASGFMKLGQKIAVDFGFRDVGFQSYQMTDDNGNISGTFTPTEYSIGIGMAYQLASGFATSLNLNYISSDMGAKVAKAVSADLGFIYKMKKINIGLKVSNLGSKIDYGYNAYSLPASIQLGAGSSFEMNAQNTITASLNTGYFLHNSSVFAGCGVEYSYNNLISLRTGFHYGDKTKGIPPFLSSGLGLHYKGITFDFAYLFAGNDSSVKSSFSAGLGYKF